MKKYRKTVRLASDNIQLLDIFHDHYYVEIGHVNYQIITKILQDRVVKLDQIVHYDIQSVGLGHSNNPNELLARHLPYLYFMGINEENQSMQVFLTYGLLVYNDNQKNEKFAPIVLMPVSLFFENELFSLSLDANPIPNDMLVDYFKARDLVLPPAKLETIDDFVKYCYAIARLSGCDIKLENYLTFARTLCPTIVMNHDRFSLNKDISWPLGHEIYRKERDDVYFVSHLSFRQRQAVERASKGNSFAIIGPLGTGKSATLYNIVADAILRDRKVLYLSAQKRTLLDLEDQLQEDHLAQLFVNLSHSFNDAVIKCKHHTGLEMAFVDGDAVKKNLTQCYDLLQKYEDTITDRIMNFRFIDVLMRLLLNPIPSDIIPIDDLSNLYKHEYYEVIESLAAIEKDMHKIPKFKESKFIHIPVNHQIEYPNQILTLLFQLYRNFVALYERVRVLENEYHFAKIPNYARFKNVINNIRGLEWKKVPSSWKKPNLANYHKANKLYQIIKAEMYSMQEQELYLDWDYQGLHEFNVSQAISLLCSSYWQETDHEAINNIIIHHQEVLSQLRIGVHNIHVYQDSSKTIQQLMQWNFDPDCDEAIKLIVDLTDFLKNHKVHDKWLNINRYQELKTKLTQTCTILKRYEYLESQYLRYFASLDDLDNSIITLVKMEARGQQRAKFKGIVLEDFIVDLKELKSIISNLANLKHQYFSLTGIEYLRSENTLQDFEACYLFVTSIQNEEYRRPIVRFLSTGKDLNLKEVLQDLNNFVYSYHITNDLYTTVISYFPQIHHVRHVEKRNFILESFDYFTHVNEVNNQIHHVIKKSKEVVAFEDYLTLRERQTKLLTIKDQINNNKDYHRLYGKMFQRDKTNINEIGLLIKAYGLYIECFDNPEAIQANLEATHMEAIQTILNETDPLFEALADQFKTYSKLFHDGIGGFYYDDFEYTIDHMNELMNAKDELLVYLDITNHLKTLYRYKLFLLSNLVINNGIDEFVKLFDYTYFTMLYERFMEEHSNLRDTDVINEGLDSLLKSEDAYYQLNLNALRDKHPNVGAHFGYQRIQYNDLIHKANKPLYLATPAVLNHFIDLDYFDVVIIDDAQLLHANEYYLAVKAKQLVIAGEDVIHTAHQSTLLSRMRSSYIVNFNDRFIKTPLQFSSQIPLLHAPFYEEVKCNQAITVINNHIVGEVLTRIIENSQLKMNVFIRNLANKRVFYEEFALQAIQQGLSVRMIERIFMNNLLIVDLMSGYSRSADMSVLYLSDYNDMDLEYIDMTKLSNLILVQQQLILFDPDHLLEKDSSQRFMKSIQGMIQLPINPFIHQETALLMRLKNHFEDQGFHVLGSYQDISMIFEKDGRYQGLIIYYDVDRDHYEMIEDHRLYHDYGKEKGIRIFRIHILDLYEQFDRRLAILMKDAKS
ncbi:MAG: hypothetical protein WC182_04855 [Bacilli bacterium]